MQIEDCYRKSMEVNGEHVVIDILDTAGTEQFSAMRDMYMREGETARPPGPLLRLNIVPGDGFVFVYSIVAYSSFNELLDIHEMLDRVTEGANKPVMLLGNKADLEAQRMVTRESGRQMVRALCIARVAFSRSWVQAAQWSAMFSECSAKTGEGIDEAFVALVQKILSDRAAKLKKVPVASKKMQLTKACVVL